MNKVLRLDLSGTPTSWLTREDAAVLYSKALVQWEYGAQDIVLLGGINRLGVQSKLAMSPIIATKGEVGGGKKVSDNFTNRMLFKRDNYQCMYCGFDFHYADFTRDHIIPRSKGGKDRWENVVAACKRCNHSKADRTPEQAGMPLLAVPFRPNIFESMYLAQHTVIADQMDYLSQRFSGKRSWSAA